MTGVAAGGNLGIEVRFRSASGQFTGATAYSDRRRGTLLDGVYVMQATVPVLAESGPWTVSSSTSATAWATPGYLNANDLAAAGFPTSFTATADGDHVAPQLAGFDFTPKSISPASGPQTITITAHVTDDMTGVAAGGNLGIEVRFRSASGQFTGATAYSGPTSGTLLDGVYVMQATVPALAESGPWTVEFVYLRDGVGNTRYLNANDVAAAGFPTSFTNN